MSVQFKNPPPMGERIGCGAFAQVYAHPTDPNKVIKTVTAHDASLDWLVVCFERKHDTSLPQTLRDAMPEVFDMGVYTEVSEHTGALQRRFWAVMKRYIPTPGRNDREDEAFVLECGGSWTYGDRIYKDCLTHRLPVPPFNDSHSGNVMRDPDTGAVVITDPSSGSSRVSESITWPQESGPKPRPAIRFIPGVFFDGWLGILQPAKPISDVAPSAPAKVRRVAQWKQPQLKQQFHMLGH